MIEVNDVRSMVMSLFPTGRAWDFMRGTKKIAGESEYYVDGSGENYTDGAGNHYISHGEINGDFNAAFFELICNILKDEAKKITDVLYQKFPDNPYFLIDDATNHERVFGIIPSAGATLDERKQVLLARMSNKRDDEFNGTREYLENVLRSSGFDVYVHENRFPSESVRTQIGSAICKKNTLGGGTKSKYPFYAKYPVTGWTQICANNIKKEDDANFFDVYKGTRLKNTMCGKSRLREMGRENMDIQKPYILFIGGLNYPDMATIPLSREREFRDLVLKTKETHIVTLFYINTI